MRGQFPDAREASRSGRLSGSSVLGMLGMRRSRARRAGRFHRSTEGSLISLPYAWSTSRALAVVRCARADRSEMLDGCDFHEWAGNVEFPRQDCFSEVLIELSRALRAGWVRIEYP